jgi:hypothetical protein
MAFKPRATVVELRQIQSNSPHGGLDAQHQFPIIPNHANELRGDDDQQGDQNRAGMIRKPQNPQIFRIRRKTRKFEKLSQLAAPGCFARVFPAG